MDNNNDISISLKKKSKGRRRKNVNLFGIEQDTNKQDHDTNISKRRKIQLTELNASDLTNNGDTEGSKKSKLVIQIQKDGETNSSRPVQEVTTMEEYKSVPVELFGEAILRGMGWNGDMNDAETGNKKQDIKPDVMLKSTHPDNLGIGAKGSEVQIDTDSFMPIKRVERLETGAELEKD